MSGTEKSDEAINFKRKFDEVDSDNSDHVDLGHLNHTLDNSDYSSDCSACIRNKERKKKKRVLHSSDVSDKEEINKSPDELQKNDTEPPTKVN